MNYQISPEPYQRTTWRLIETPPAEGAWNMAVDEAILEAASRGEVLPTLRLYAWQPACLSLGYAQAAGEVDLRSLATHGWSLVRRPTGGKAILHVDELTYSVAGPQSDPHLAGSVLESYQRLSQALVSALTLLDVPAAINPTATGSSSTGIDAAVCFERPSDYEITVGGKKLIGSAQARRQSGVLQHGSLPLFGDLTRITQCLAFSNEIQRQEAARRLLEHATTVEGYLGAAIEWELAAKVFAEAFARSLNLDLIPGELTHGELSRAEELVRDKYGNDSWTFRV